MKTNVGRWRKSPFIPNFGAKLQVNVQHHEHATNENIIIFHICRRNLNIRRLMCCKNEFSYLLSVQNYRVIFGHFLYASSKNNLTFCYQRPLCYKYERIAVTGTVVAHCVAVGIKLSFNIPVGSYLITWNSRKASLVFIKFVIGRSSHSWPSGKNPRKPGGTQRRFGRFGEEKNLLFLPALKPRIAKAVALSLQWLSYHNSYWMTVFAANFLSAPVPKMLF